MLENGIKTLSDLTFLDDVCLFATGTSLNDFTDIEFLKNKTVFCINYSFERLRDIGFYDWDYVFFSDFAVAEYCKRMTHGIIAPSVFAHKWYWNDIQPEFVYCRHYKETKNKFCNYEVPIEIEFDDRPPNTALRAIQVLKKFGKNIKRVYLFGWDYYIKDSLHFWSDKHIEIESDFETYQKTVLDKIEVIRAEFVTAHFETIQMNNKSNLVLDKI